MYDHTLYKQVQISRSDIRPHIKWAVRMVILHMITSIFLRALCGYKWVSGVGKFMRWNITGSLCMHNTVACGFIMDNESA